MDHTDAGKYWNDNAEVWTHLSRAGYDVYRDYLNTLVILEMLPEVRGLAGIDIGYGEGTNTRRVAEPRPSDEVVRAYPAIQDAQVVAYFLHVRARKPVG